MPQPVLDLTTDLSAAHEPPFLSLYQPTHRSHPANAQDPIRFKNLVKRLESLLLQAYPKEEVQELLEPYHELAGRHEFWNRTLDGLAVLGARGFFRVFRVQRSVPELAIVADSFHTKPLLRIQQSADRYQILAVNRHDIRLFEGNRDALDEVTPASGVPRTIAEALGDQLTDARAAVGSHGNGSGGAAVHHGHGTRRDEIDVDTERFFRAVDRALHDHHSKVQKLPVMLAALPEYHTLFHQVSHNSWLMKEGIEVNADGITVEQLRERAWKVLEPRYEARLAELVERYGSAAANGLGAESLAAIALAAIGGRVLTLLVESGRVEPGHIDMMTGQVEAGELSQPGVDDVLDDLAELVQRQGGEVIVVPGHRMPTSTGAAAIYRF